MWTRICWSLCLLLMDRSANAITYPDYFLSNYCGNGTSVIRMGTTPYYENTDKRLTVDSYSVARVLAAELRDSCDVVRNCTLYFIPPAGHRLLVTAHGVDNGHDIGSLSVHVDHRLTWLWDDDNGFNRSFNFRAKSQVDGLIKIAVRVKTVTTVWSHFDVNIVLTAFRDIVVIEAGNTSACKSGFDFDCGNRRCIRRALECDGYDNCGNNGDETFCGLDPLSAGLLFTCTALSLGFLALVFFLDSRPDVVLKLMNRKVIDDPVAAVF